MNNKQGRWRLMRPTRNFQKVVAASENGVSGFSRRISTAPPELSTAATAKRDILVNYVIGVRSDYTGTAAMVDRKIAQFALHDATYPGARGQAVRKERACGF